MNRSLTLVKNIVWELSYYLLVILLGFLAPRYIILAYGSEVNGLSSTITQILNVILILQAGATTAAIYSLYKPIAENDMKNICRGIAGAERFFKKISIIFGLIMIIVAVITSVVIDSNLKQIHIFIAFLIMGIKSFLDLFFTAKFRIVFTAYQEKFYISIATLIEQVVYYLLVFATLALQWHFVFLYVWFLFGCIIKIIYLAIVFNQKHSDINTKLYREERAEIRGRNYSLANEVSHSVISSSVTILLTFMYGLEETSVYSVYALVSSALALVSTAFYSSFGPTFGNLVAQKNNESAGKVFGIFQYLFLMVNTFLMMCMTFLIIPFVRIYTAGVTDINYINYFLVIMLALNGIFSAYRVPYNVIVSSCGYFKETWLQPVLTAILSGCISIVFGSWNYELIILGPIVFYAINFLYQFFKIKKLAPRLINKRVFGLLGISTLGLSLSFCATINISVPANVWWWLLSAIIFSIFALLFIIISTLIVDREDFKSTYEYMRRVLSRR